MKKLFYFLLSIIIIFAVDCKKIDDFATVGEKGPKGDKGDALLFYVDLQANTKVWFQDKDTNLVFSAGDKVYKVETQSGLTIANNPTGGYNILKIVGTDTTAYPVTNGTNGTNGHDAHEFVLGSRPQPDGSQFLDFFWDTKGPGFGMLTPDDSLKYTLIIPKPEKGDKGDTPLFQVNIEKIGNKIVYSVTTIEGTKTASADIPYQTVYSVTPFTDMKGDTTMNLLKGFADLDGSRTVNMGDSLLFTLPVKNGTRGDRGYTEVTKVTPIMDGTTVVGNHFDKYLDIDGIPGYSSGDQPLYSGYDILNGLTGATGATGDTGPRGPAGETPIVEWNIGLTSTTSSGNVEIVFSLTINGETKTATVEIPRAEVEHGGHVRCEKKDHKNTFSWCGGNDNNDHSHDRKLGECNDR